MWPKVGAIAGLIALVSLAYFTGDLEDVVMLLCFFSLSITILFARLSRPSAARNVCMYPGAVAALVNFTAYMVDTWGERPPSAGLLVWIGFYLVHILFGQEFDVFSKVAFETPAGVSKLR